MNLYREIDTEKIQFDFAMTSGKKALYDDEVLQRGGRIFYFDTSRNIRENFRDILRNQGPFRAVHSHVFFYSGLLLADAKRAGVPVRIAQKTIGKAHVVCARTRPKFIGGERAVYDLHLSGGDIPR